MTSDHDRQINDAARRTQSASGPGVVSEIISVVRLSTYVAAPPQRVWLAVRQFKSHSPPREIKILHQESGRKLIYAITGLPPIIKRMTGEIELRPDGAGTWLHWSVRFSTKPTLFSRLFRPLLRAGIARTLRRAARAFKARMEGNGAEPN